MLFEMICVQKYGQAAHATLTERLSIESQGHGMFFPLVGVAVEGIPRSTLVRTEKIGCQIFSGHIFLFRVIFSLLVYCLASRAATSCLAAMS